MAFLLSSLSGAFAGLLNSFERELPAARRGCQDCSPADCRSRRIPLKSPCGFHVAEVAKVIVDADVVQHPAKPAEGNAHTVGAAEAAELPAALDVRFQIEEHARNAAPGQLAFQRR